MVGVKEGVQTVVLRRVVGVKEGVTDCCIKMCGWGEGRCSKLLY